MLQKLPREIIFTVLLNLGFGDKLNLVLTCRKLQELIPNSVLYEELSFYRRQDTLLSVLEYFKRKPIYGSQVRRLKLKNMVVSSQTLSQIPIVFPNIREFTSTNDQSVTDKSHMEPMMNWKDTLEKCNIPIYPCEIPYLLKNNTFSRLTSLSIRAPKELNAINRNPYDYFANAPLLNDLRIIGGAVFSFGTFEKAIIPYLHELHQPRLLLSLTLDWGTDIEYDRYPILDYIIAKYTQLIELVVFCEWNDIMESRDEIAFYNRNHNNSHDIEFYRRGDGFLPNLPNTIKKLKMNRNLFTDPLAALQKSGINPTELGFYEDNGMDIFPGEVIKHQKHVDYINGLNHLKTLAHCVRCNVNNHNDSMVFDNITHLTAKMLDNQQDDGYKLDQLFLTYPSLKILTIHEGGDFLTASSPFTQKTYPNFRKLTIKNKKFD